MPGPPAGAVWHRATAPRGTAEASRGLLRQPRHAAVGSPGENGLRCSDRHVTPSARRTSLCELVVLGTPASARTYNLRLRRRSVCRMETVPRLLGLRLATHRVAGSSWEMPMPKSKAVEPVRDNSADAELVDFPRVEQITGGLSRTTINRRIEDGSLPRPVVLSRDRHGRPLRVAVVLAEGLAYNRRAIVAGGGSAALR